MVRVGINVGGSFAELPGVYPMVDTTAMIPVLSNIGGIPLAIVSSDGGDPNRVYSFRSYQEAKAVLRGGRCLSYLARMFNPSPTQPGAPVVKVIRGNAATQSTFMLGGSGNPEVVFTSRDYGTWTNQIRVGLFRAISDDTGLPLTSGQSPTYYHPWTISVDHVPSGQSYFYQVRSGILLSAGNSLEIDYTSYNRITYTMSDSSVHYASFTDLQTLRDLATWINNLNGATVCTIVGPSDYPTTTLVEITTTLSDGNPIFHPAEYGVLKHILNLQNPLISLEVDSGASFDSAPGSTVAPTYLTTGSGSSVDPIDSSAVAAPLALAETTEAHLLFIQSSAAEVQALGLAHCEAMGTDLTRKFRIYVTGINFTGSSNVDGADGTATLSADAALEAVTRAAVLEGPCVFCWNGSAAANPETGISEQLGGLGVSAQIIGMRSGMLTAEPLTNKAVRSNGLEFPYLTESTKVALVEGGVLGLAYREESLETRIIQALTTYQTSNPSFRLLQGLWIQHVIKRMWMLVLSQYIGGTLDLDTGLRIKADCAKALDQSIKSGSNQNGFLTEGRDINGIRVPAWDSLRVVGDSTLGAWTISVNVHPVGETDFITVITKLTPAPLYL